MEFADDDNNNDDVDGGFISQEFEYFVISNLNNIFSLWIKKVIYKNCLLLMLLLLVLLLLRCCCE